MISEKLPDNILDILLDNCQGLTQIKSIPDVAKIQFNLIDKTIAIKDRILFENNHWSTIKLRFDSDNEFTEVDLNEYKVFPDVLNVDTKTYLNYIKEYLARMLNSYGPNYESNFISNVNSTEYLQSMPRNIAKILIEYLVFFGIMEKKFTWKDICDNPKHFYVSIQNNIFYKSWFNSQSEKEVRNAKIHFRRS